MRDARSLRCRHILEPAALVTLSCSDGRLDRVSLPRSRAGICGTVGAERIARPVEVEHDSDRCRQGSMARSVPPDSCRSHWWHRENRSRAPTLPPRSATGGPAAGSSPSQRHDHDPRLGRIHLDAIESEEPYRAPTLRREQPPDEHHVGIKGKYRGGRRGRAGPKTVTATRPTGPSTASVNCPRRNGTPRRTWRTPSGPLSVIRPLCSPSDASARRSAAGPHHPDRAIATSRWAGCAIAADGDVGADSSQASKVGTLTSQLSAFWAWSTRGGPGEPTPEERHGPGATRDER